MFTVSTVAEQSATTCSGLVNFVRWRPTMDTTGSLIVEPQECRAAYAAPSFHTMEAPPPSRRSIMLSTRVRAAASVPLSQCGGALACAAAVTSFASAAFRASSMPEAPAHSIDCRSRETCSFWWKIKSNNADRLNEQSAVPSARYADTSRIIRRCLSVSYSRRRPAQKRNRAFVRGVIRYRTLSARVAPPLRTRAPRPATVGGTHPHAGREARSTDPRRRSGPARPTDSAFYSYTLPIRNCFAPLLISGLQHTGRERAHHTGHSKTMAFQRFLKLHGQQRS